jgi:hypothetical protein
MQAHAEHVRRKRPAPRVKVNDKDGIAQLSADHPDQAVGYTLLMAALGTTDVTFAHGLIGQLANAGSQGRKVDPDGLNFMLAVVKGVEPRDEIEAMLASQMAAVHMASMTFARRLAHVDTIRQQDGAERAFNKLTRTFAIQADTLKRYRSAGHRRVTVEHVTVNDGGQAIVGSVSAGSRGTDQP